MLPPAVQALLRERVTSFECLELLLVLHAHPQESIDLQTLSQRTGLSTELTAGALHELEIGHLVSRGAIAPLTFRLAPVNASLSDAVDELVRLHRDQRAAIMAEMSVNAIGRIRLSSLRAFADAFFIGARKKDSDA